MKIVIAPDSFKGSLSAKEVAHTIAKAVLEVCPDAETVEIPLADGGEGLVEVLSEAMDGELTRCRVTDPLGRPIDAEYILGDGEAFMEMASPAGLPLLSESERNPLRTSTFGVGEMILHAFDHGARKIYIGLGGSATNDGGMGMLKALGYRLLDTDGKDLKGVGADLEKIVDIDGSEVDSRLENVEFVAACDVDNPFYGPNGAAHVFAPQKGADSEMARILDRGMRSFADVVLRKYGIDLQAIPGAGAAGGLGGAFAALLGAKMQHGIEMVLDAVDFDERIKGADLIITGEGSLDRQSLMGKVLSGVLARAKRLDIPVVAFAGRVADHNALYDAGLLAAIPIIQSPCTLAEAMNPSVARTNLTASVSQTLRIWLCALSIY